MEKYAVVAPIEEVKLASGCSCGSLVKVKGNIAFCDRCGAKEKDIKEHKD